MDDSMKPTETATVETTPVVPAPARVPRRGCPRRSDQAGRDDQDDCCRTAAAKKPAAKKGPGQGCCEGCC